MRNAFYILLIAVCLAVTFYGGRKCSGSGGSGGSGAAVRTIVRRDTVVLRDTVRELMPLPQRVYIVRTDTVWVGSVADTARLSGELPVLLPIEVREYRTDDYHAVIEGFRPTLREIAVFPKTKIITTTEQRMATRARRWGAGLQAGYGRVAGRWQPYIGVGVQYNVFTW